MADNGEGTVSLSSAFTNKVLINALHDSSPRLGTAAAQLMTPQSKYVRFISEKIKAGFQSFATSSVLWVNGPAGVGKSTLMQSFSDILLPRPNSAGPSYEDTEKTHSYIGTSFFFSHKNKATDSRRFFITLAYGLALRVPALAPFIQAAFDNNNARLLDMSLEKQCEVLILYPIHSWVRSAEDTDTDTQLLMIIDGLEECDGGKETHLDIIRAIHQAFSLSIGGVRWQWIISSRMEAWIYSASLQLAPASQHVSISLTSDDDINVYFQNSFSSIHLSRPLPFRVMQGSRIHINLPASSVAHKRDIAALCWQTGGYFAYAASLVDYVERGTNSHERLRELVRIMRLSVSQQPQSDHPFAKLDAMYHDILQKVPLGSQELTKRVLGAVSIMQPSGSEDTIPSAKTVASLLEISFDDICKALYYLHSVVAAPLNPEPLSFGQYLNNPIDTEMHFFHKSFNEFLRDPNRSLGWSIDMEGMHADIAKCCLRRIADLTVIHTYAAKRWFVHCWRTGVDTDAAFGMLPELYDFDYTLLPWNEMIDRYFVEWLLHLEELTMSEYLILNAGPEYSLELGQGPTPPRPTYILGFEPSKQVLLVPMFDHKDRYRQDIGMRIGPSEEHWDLIRGFRTLPLSAAFDDVNVDIGEETSIEEEVNASEDDVPGVGERGEENIVENYARDRETDGYWNPVEVGRVELIGATPESEGASNATGVAEDDVEDEESDSSECIVERDGVTSTAGGPKDVGKNAERGNATDSEEGLSDLEVVIVKSAEELDEDEDDWVELGEADRKSNC